MDHTVHSVRVGELSWRGCQVRCATCGAERDLELQVRAVDYAYGEQARAVCPKGHQVPHPMIYPEMVHALRKLDQVDQAGVERALTAIRWRPHSTATTGWYPWKFPSDAEHERDFWPEVAEAWLAQDRRGEAIKDDEDYLDRSVTVPTELRWRGVPVRCGTCEETLDLTLHLQRSPINRAEQAWAVCPEGHQVWHPLIYPEMVTVLLRLDLSMPGDLGMALSVRIGWRPHYTTRSDDPGVQPVVNYRPWACTEDAEQQRAQWPEVTAAYLQEPAGDRPGDRDTVWHREVAGELEAELRSGRWHPTERDVAVAGELLHQSGIEPEQVDENGMPSLQWRTDRLARLAKASFPYARDAQAQRGLSELFRRAIHTFNYALEELQGYADCSPAERQAYVQLRSWRRTVSKIEALTNLYGPTLAAVWSGDLDNQFG